MGDYLHFALGWRKHPGGVNGIFQKIAQHHAEFRLGDRKFPGQIYRPFHRDAKLLAEIIVIGGNGVYCEIGAQGDVRRRQGGLVVGKIFSQSIQIAFLGKSTDHYHLLAKIVADSTGFLDVLRQHTVLLGLEAEKLILAFQMCIRDRSKAYVFDEPC